MGIFPKRNAPLKRAGKPPKGSRRNLRDTGGEKIVGRSGMASGKKTFARRDALRSCPQSGDRAAADGCPRALKPRALRTEFPHPFCASGPADRGVDQGTRFYRSRPVRRGQHRYCRGRTVCRRRGRRAWIPRPASGCPVSRMSGAPRILLLTRAWPNMRAGTETCSGPGELRDPGFHPDRCRDAGG